MNKRVKILSSQFSAAKYLLIVMHIFSLSLVFAMKKFSIVLILLSLNDLDADKFVLNHKHVIHSYLSYFKKLIQSNFFIIFEILNFEFCQCFISENEVNKSNAKVPSIIES